jgi:pyruvate kinase
MAETADTRAAAMRWPDVSDRTIRRTKIVCTLGPSTDPPGRLTDLATIGLDVARLNFSHGTLDAHLARLRAVEAAREATGKPIAILADLQGPKLRVGVLPEPVTLGADETVYLAGAGAGREGDLELGFELDMATYLRRGRPVMINDGLVRLRVEEVEGSRARCRVEVGGVVSSQKGVNLPGTYLPIPSITDQDRQNLAFAVEHDVDFVALSFVRRAEDVEELRQLIKGHGGRQRIVAKIEKPEAVEQLDAIVAVTDGLMVARGDLGVEMGAAQVPLAQKRIIRLGREAGKPVITATQMLESMVSSPEPTRAEASDVANAVLDGTSAVMLSAETAVGQYPVEAVSTLVRIALAVEPSFDYHEGGYRRAHGSSRAISDVVGHAACDMAEVLEVEAIVVPTVTGESAREVSKHRPRRPVIACTPTVGVQQQLMLDWAVVPLRLNSQDSVEDLWRGCMEAVLESGIANPGDRIVITSGTNVNRPGATNTILVQAL